MNWTYVFEAVITLIIVFISTIIIPYIKTKLGAETFEQIKRWIKVAVQAAEMIYTETGMGKQKKIYVEDFLSHSGIDLDAEKLDSLIESAVLELKKGIE